MFQFALFSPLLMAVACAAAPPAGTGAGTGSTYPPRSARCALTLTSAPLPALTAWDDLGKIEVTCHMDIGELECLQRFRTEACRRGADIIYAMPEKPVRPREQAYAFRGRLAHTRTTTELPAPPATGDVERDAAAK